jgi:hypothetical protein
MQVFIIGTPIATARALDRKRLNKQIIECQQILDALNGATAWSNHPCVLQYKGHEFWLRCYKRVLKEVQKGGGASIRSRYFNYRATDTTPDWHTQEYYNQMKRRLYSKDPEYYKQWAHLGTSDENWYFVDEEWRKYINGKRIE